ncbi:hypothetical protein KIPB_003334 [Kipferlia bialata]|uniref:Uncharacterized protein n=1 Tax=Kipferlia bialata TaxID=797122 RepID=A0A9K3CV86_9EUKA|nr:hypothetical protein KIPB_003334 [Kipferlia bialata]|eukprot:g3334.t1
MSHAVSGEIEESSEEEVAVEVAPAPTEDAPEDGAHTEEREGGTAADGVAAKEAHRVLQNSEIRKLKLSLDRVVSDATGETMQAVNKLYGKVSSTNPQGQTLSNAALSAQADMVEIVAAIDGIADL